MQRKKNYPASSIKTWISSSPVILVNFLTFAPRHVWCATKVPRPRWPERASARRAQPAHSLTCKVQPCAYPVQLATFPKWELPSAKLALLRARIPGKERVLALVVRLTKRLKNPHPLIIPIVCVTRVSSEILIPKNASSAQKMRLAMVARTSKSSFHMKDFSWAKITLSKSTNACTAVVSVGAKTRAMETLMGLYAANARPDTFCRATNASNVRVVTNGKFSW